MADKEGSDAEVHGKSKEMRHSGLETKQRKAEGKEYVTSRKKTVPERMTKNECR